jgi:predicted metalloprotease
MRIDGQRESGNIEDRRGMGPARMGRAGGLSVGTIVLALAISYFTGANPLTVLQMITGVQSMTDTMVPSAPSEPGQVGAPSDDLGKFASIVLADTETTWQTLLGPRYEDPRMVLLLSQRPASLFRLGLFQ